MFWQLQPVLKKQLLDQTAHIVFWPVTHGRRKIFSHLQETHAHRGNQLVCVKSRQTDVIVVMCDHGDTVSTHLY